MGFVIFTLEMHLVITILNKWYGEKHSLKAFKVYKKCMLHYVMTATVAIRSHTTTKWRNTCLCACLFLIRLCTIQWEISAFQLSSSSDFRKSCEFTGRNMLDHKLLYNLQCVTAAGSIWFQRGTSAKEGNSLILTLIHIFKPKAAHYNHTDLLASSGPFSSTCDGGGEEGYTSTAVLLPVSRVRLAQTTGPSCHKHPLLVKSTDIKIL